MEAKSVVIKRVRKNTHGGAHGGSWKVAYADFVTAMMAFFLLLWLISMVSPEKKAKVSQYFKHFSVFEKSGSSIMESHPPGNLGTGAAPIPELASDDERQAPSVPPEASSPERLKKEIENQLQDFKDQIVVSGFDGGIRIELVEKDGSPMFPSAGTELTPEGKRILGVITENIKGGKAKVAVEGHTDAKGFASRQYSNWELSTERASAARKELEKNGLAPERLVRIAGYAATQPLIKDDPHDPKNRRITILLFEEEKPPPKPPVVSRNAAAEGPRSAQVGKKIHRGAIPFDPVEQYLVGR